MADKPLIPYIRQSRKKEHTISLDEQRREIEAWANREGVKLAAEVVEQGVSGSKHWKERELGTAVEACEEGRAAGIIVAYQDRLTRESGLGTAEVWDALDKANARLVCAAEGLDTARGSDDDEMTFSVKAALARLQWKRHRRNWANARRSAVEYGIHPSSRVPIGYRRNEKEPRVPSSAERAKLTAEERWADPVRRQLVPSEHAGAIRDLFKLRAAGGSWTECAKLLEERGVLNMKGEPFWNHSAVQTAIRNPVYKGWAFLLSRGKQDGDLINEQAHEPIVDPLLWKAAQPQKGKPRKKASEGALLSGVLRCASCKRRLSPSQRFYRCRPGMVSGPECDAPANVSAAEAEALVTRAFFDCLAYRPQGPTPPDLAPLDQAAALAKADEAKWKEAAIAGTVAPEVVGPAYDAAKARREEAERQLFEARQTAGLDDERLTLAERWGTMSVPERRRALRAFEVVAYVERGRQPVDERLTIELRGSPVGDGWEPDVEYTLPSDQELAEKIAAEFAAAGISTSVKEVAGRIASWNAKYADARVVIKPIKLSEEDKATEEAIFGPLGQASRKRQREAKRKPRAAA